MRVTCPNCGAEYDVPEGLIPPAGKHVQCTACHTRWFRRGEAREELSEDEILRKLETRAARPGPRLVPPGGAEGAVPFPAPGGMAPEPEDEQDERPEDADWAALGIGPDDAAADPGPDADAAADPDAGAGRPAAAGPVSMPAAYRLTPDRPRAAPVSAPDGGGPDAAPAPEAGPLGPTAPGPTKPGAVPTAPRDTAAPAPEAVPSPAPARDTPAYPVAESGEAARPDPRPELREAPRHTSRIEIADAQEASAPPRRRGRFLPGFILALLLAGLAFEVYVWREPLAAQVPAAAPAIEGYATSVDAAREWLGARFGKPETAAPAN